MPNPNPEVFSPIANHMLIVGGSSGPEKTPRISLSDRGVVVIRQKAVSPIHSPVNHLGSSNSIASLASHASLDFGKTKSYQKVSLPDGPL